MPAAGEAAGVAREVGANSARDLREDAGRAVPSYLRDGPREAARSHSSEVQQEGLYKLCTCAGHH